MTSTASARETVTAALTGKFEVLPQALRPEQPLAELGLESLDVVELIYTVNRDLGIRIGEDEVTTWNTLGELLALAEARTGCR
ncbi:acyl carrier protein [Streptomyces sp. NPDC001118]|uniref:acyl carrier protein n=1 Tax=unclassified Streptomyces TaxID=2593676 RepID=UPI00331B215C